MGNKNSTIDDVMEAIGTFSNKVDGRLGKLEDQAVWVKSNMVTRDLFDEKLNDLKADLTILMRKEDHKLVALIELLKSKSVISEEESQKVLALEPFPKS